MAASDNLLISIITVVKDDFPGFLITAESLQLQVTRGFEWIIVDGSVGKEISDFIASPGFAQISVKYMRQSPNGIYSAMNLGLVASSGLFIWYLNAGDFLGTSQATEIVAREVVDYETSLAFPVLHVSPSGSIYAVSSPSIKRISQLETHAVLNHQGVLVPREIIIQAGGFDESLRLAADGKLLDFVASNYNIKTCPQFVVIFTHGGASSASHKGVWDEIDLYRTRTISNHQIRIRSLKSFIRAVLFRFERVPFARNFIRVLLRRRSNRLLKNYKIQRQDLDILFSR